LTVSRRFGQNSERIDDEAIIELNAEISEIKPPQREHVGEHIECSLICSRSYMGRTMTDPVRHPYREPHDLL
jgi:hypothetical protein